MPKKSNNSAASKEPKAQANSTKDGKTLTERYKTRTCKNFMATGFCPYYHRCMFAHGHHEVRTVSMNVRDGLNSASAIKAFQQAQASYYEECAIMAMTMEQMRGRAQQQVPHHGEHYAHHGSIENGSMHPAYDPSGSNGYASHGPHMAGNAYAHAQHHLHQQQQVPIPSLEHCTSPLPVSEEFETETTTDDAEESGQWMPVTCGDDEVDSHSQLQSMGGVTTVASSQFQSTESVPQIHSGYQASSSYNHDPYARYPAYSSPVAAHH